MTPWTSPRRLARAFSRLPQSSLLPGRGHTSPVGALSDDVFEPLPGPCTLAEPPPSRIDEEPVSEHLLQTLREAGL